MVQEVLLHHLAELWKCLHQFFDILSKQDFNGVSIRVYCRLCGRESFLSFGRKLASEPQFEGELNILEFRILEGLASHAWNALG